MTVTTIQATYIQGVLKPMMPVNLPEGATVEIRIVSPARPAVNRFGALAGKLSYLSDQVVDDIERELFILVLHAPEAFERESASGFCSSGK